MGYDSDLDPKFDALQAQIDALGGGNTDELMTASLRVQRKMAESLLSLDTQGRLDYYNNLLTLL